MEMVLGGRSIRCALKETGPRINSVTIGAP
jgi:hypothetical protein